MSIFVFISVMVAALLHAAWNALVKNGEDKQAGMLLLTLGHAFFGLCLIPFFSIPTGQVWLWLLASGVIHSFYQLFLGFAYERGDLSRVYPIARGGAPVIVLVASLFFGIDSLGLFDLIGILVVGLGILLLGLGVFSLDEDRKLIPLALGSAFATAGYSIVDGMGARLSLLDDRARLRGVAVIVRAGGCWCRWRAVVNPPRLGNGLEVGDVSVDVAKVKGSPVKQVNEIGGRAYNRLGAGRFDVPGFEIISEQCGSPSAVGLRLGFCFRATA